MEDVTIRRRNRLRRHYTMTSNVLLFGYHHLSDAAKVTYLAVDSFDWGDGSGKRKGYAFPSLGRLSRDRGVNRRTIRRHLAELEKVGLVTRQQRPGQPNLLIIEDPSADESERYLRRLSDGGSDRTVLPTPDRTIRPYKKEKKQEGQILVNEEVTLPVGSRGQANPPEHISHALGEIRSKIRWRVPLDKAKREYLAQEMLAVLKDRHSLGYYRRVAQMEAPRAIFEALSIVRQAAREGAVRVSRGAMFTSLMRRRGVALGTSTPALDPP